MSYFLDTNICIYALKGTYPTIAERLQQHSPQSIKIPSIVKAELLYGAEKSSDPEKTLHALESFLLPFEVAPFGDGAVAHYARIRATLEREGQPIGPNDIIIAATVLDDGGVLVSHNLGEFQRVVELEVQDWTR